MNAPDSAALARQTSMNNWQASLQMAFERHDETTRPTLRKHFGPLRALRGFSAPRGESDLYEQIIVHPPGGIAPGDQLSIELDAGPDTNTILTSPGAAKWYRTGESTVLTPASQSVRVNVGHGACLEWLPMENIIFNTARAELNMVVNLDVSASFIGADMICLGRPANHETFDAGLLRSRTLLYRNSQPIFNEQWVLTGSDPVLKARAGLAGASCFASLWLVPSGNCSEKLDGLVELARQGVAPFSDELSAVTALDHLVVVRWFGQHAETGWQVLRSAWRSCRHEINGQTGTEPRIWQC